MSSAGCHPRRVRGSAAPNRSAPPGVRAAGGDAWAAAAGADTAARGRGWLRRQNGRRDRRTGRRRLWPERAVRRRGCEVPGYRLGWFPPGRPNRRPPPRRPVGAATAAASRRGRRIGGTGRSGPSGGGFGSAAGRGAPCCNAAGLAGGSASHRLRHGDREAALCRRGSYRSRQPSAGSAARARLGRTAGFRRRRTGAFRLRPRRALPAARHPPFPKRFPSGLLPPGRQPPAPPPRCQRCAEAARTRPRLKPETASLGWSRQPGHSMARSRWRLAKPVLLPRGFSFGPFKQCSGQA